MIGSRTTSAVRSVADADPCTADETVPWAERIGRLLESGEGIVPVFQPIVSIRDGSLVGYEALARFPSPRVDRIRAQMESDFGSERADKMLDSNGWGLGPYLWFEAAGSLDLRADLEILALRCALASLHLIPPGVYLSVNASAETVTDPRLSAELDRHDLARVVLEVTENDVVSDYGPILAALGPLRRAGAGLSIRCLRVAVDDVGAGTSMRHLAELGADVVKLDRSIVRHVDTNEARQALVMTFGLFARTTGASSVAEGVETAEEAFILRQLGIDCGQGYYFARPSPLPLGDG